MNPFLQEYNSESSIRRYVSGTAGRGIDYLLHHVYGPLYVDTVEAVVADVGASRPLRLLEFGCGGAMNLIYLLGHLEAVGISVEAAYGTDFSDKMIIAARAQAERRLSATMFERTRFLVASNEALREELSSAKGLPHSGFDSYFHLILGVNTFRYCWRLGEGERCAGGIYKMLANGGRVIIIDMNKKFPYFLSRIRNVRNALDNSERSSSIAREKSPRATALPTVGEYIQPFAEAGFEIQRRETFCWIPHSAGSFRLSLGRSLTPVLDKIARTHAMRVLLIARKPL